MPYIIFVLQIPTFWGVYAWLLIGVKGQKRRVDRCLSFITTVALKVALCNDEHVTTSM